MVNEKGIVLLGSTGSIGTQTIDLAEKKGIRIAALSAGKNAKLAEEQARRLMPKFCAMADENAANHLKSALADTDIEVLCGNDGICEMIAKSSADCVLDAISGAAGLLPALTAIEQKKTLALANKECLVMAGDILMKKAAENKVEIRPIDSEHSAIWQCLRSGRENEVKKLILTASGGPFFGLTKDQLYNKSVKDTLAHPTWNMGAGITVDSATLMNKGFEVIEAAKLFCIDASRIDVIVHRESIIHSMVEYIDNSVIAQLSVPDMRFCVQYAVNYPERDNAVIDTLDLFSVGALHFARPDYKTFSLLACAIEAIKKGGALPAVLNAANEVAVAAFLNREISFYDITELVGDTVTQMEASSKYTSLEDILACDVEARRVMREKISKRCK